MTCAVTINAPTAGKLLISASSQMEHTDTSNCPGVSGTSQNQVKQAIRAGPAQNTVKSNRDDLGDRLGAHQGSITAGVDVAAGVQTVTYSMIVRYGGTCPNGTQLDYRFFDPSVEVVFVEGPG